MRRFLRISAAALLPLALGGCTGSDKPEAPAVPEFQEARLQQGRGIWMQVCRNCHLMGVAGAPAINNYTAWQPRLAKGEDALYASAINGIRKGEGWSMPPRGGNNALSDADIERAVDFMLAAVKQLREEETP